MTIKYKYVLNIHFYGCFVFEHAILFIMHVNKIGTHKVVSKFRLNLINIFLNDVIFTFIATKINLQYALL